MQPRATRHAAHEPFYGAGRSLCRNGRKTGWQPYPYSVDVTGCFAGKRLNVNFIPLFLLRGVSTQSRVPAPESELMPHYFPGILTGQYPTLR